MPGLELPPLIQLPGAQPPLSHLPPYDGEELQFPLHVQHTQQELFLLSGLSAQLPGQHLPGGKPDASEINERRTVVSKDTAK